MTKKQNRLNSCTDLCALAAARPPSHQHHCAFIRSQEEVVLRLPYRKLLSLLQQLVVRRGEGQPVKRVQFHLVIQAGVGRQCRYVVSVSVSLHVQTERTVVSTVHVHQARRTGRPSAKVQRNWSVIVFFI